MKDLDFKPVKTRGQFLSNYEKHDPALAKVKMYFRQRQFTVIDYGPDRRNERIWGDNRPDLLIWKPYYWLALLDAKGHSGDIWMLNKRAYDDYLGYSRHHKIPVFCIWVNLETGQIYYAELPFLDVDNDFMPHDKNKVVKTKNAKRIDSLIERLRMTTFEDKNNGQGEDELLDMPFE